MLVCRQFQARRSSVSLDPVRTLAHATAAPIDGGESLTFGGWAATLITPSPKGSNTVAQMRKKSEHKGCGGTLPEDLNTLLEPLEDGSKRFGLACCVARGVIKYGSLRCMTTEKLGDYVNRGEAVYEHLGPKSKPHVDFVQRLEAELKFKNLSRYFYGSMCRCHLDNVRLLVQRVEKKLSSAAPGAAQVVPGRTRCAKMDRGDTKRQKVERPSDGAAPSVTPRQSPTTVVIEALPLA